MNILVTGGAGYKGVKLSKKLLDLGYRVSISDNFMYGYEPVLHLTDYKNLEIIKRDIRNGIDNLKQYDVIFHLAGISGYPACEANPSSAQLINVDATRKLVRSLGKNQIIINASTTSFYGKTGNLCTEETKIKTVSMYAITKYQAEQIVAEKENSINLRFATVFGLSPKMRLDLMVNDFTYRAVKDRALVLFDSYAKRTFIHIDDAVDCYIFALKNYNQMKGGIYNAGGNNNNYSKLEIAELIKQQIDYKIIDSDIKDKDVRDFIISFDKISKIGFKPKKSVADGIRELIRIFRFYEYASLYKII